MTTIGFYVRGFGFLVPVTTSSKLTGITCSFFGDDSIWHTLVGGYIHSKVFETNLISFGDITANPSLSQATFGLAYLVKLSFTAN